MKNLNKILLAAVTVIIFFTGCETGDLESMVEKASLGYISFADDTGSATVMARSTSSSSTSEKPTLVFVENDIEYTKLTKSASVDTDFYQSYLLEDKYSRSLPLTLTVTPATYANVGIDEANSQLYIMPLEEGNITIELNTTVADETNSSITYTSSATLILNTGDSGSSGGSTSTLTLSSTSKSVVAGSTETVTYTSSTGTVSVSSSNNSVATAAVSTTNSTITITGVSTGSATITVTNGTDTLTISVTVTNSGGGSGVENNPYLDPGYFTARDDVDLASTYLSNTVTAISLPSTVNVTFENAQLRVNGTTYDEADSPVEVSNGDQLALIVTSGNSYDQAYIGSLTINGITSDFVVTTYYQNDSTVEDNFDFTDKTGASLNTDYESEEALIEGITLAVEATVTGGSLFVNDVEYTTFPVELVKNNVIKLGVTTGSNYNTTTTATLTIGSLEKTFSVTTLDSNTYISLIDQRLRRGQEVDLPITQYIVTQTGTPECTITGSLPSGLTINEATCSISGTVGTNAQSTSITISVEIPGVLDEPLTKTISLAVTDYDSTVYKTDQSTIYLDGDDGYYHDTIGITRQYTSKITYGTLQDNLTGLEWLDINPDTNNDGVVNSSDYLSVEDATTYCDELSFAGFTNWRLPTIEELMTVMEHDVPFNNMVENYYWTSSTYAGDSSQNWYIDFTNGRKIYHISNTKKYSVRCVKG